MLLNCATNGDCSIDTIPKEEEEEGKEEEEEEEEEEIGEKEIHERHEDERKAGYGGDRDCWVLRLMYVVMTTLCYPYP